MSNNDSERSYSVFNCVENVCAAKNTVVDDPIMFMTKNAMDVALSSVVCRKGYPVGM